VRRDDDGVEGLLGAVGELQGDPPVGPPDRRDGAVRADPPREALEEGLDVGPAAAGDVVPRRVVPHRQEAVVRVEPGEGLHGELHRLGLRGRPDGRGHGDDELLDHVPPEPLAARELAEGEAAQFSLLEEFLRAPAEMPDAPEERPEGGPEEVFAPGEEAVEAEAAVAETGRVVLAAEGHVRRRRRDAELPQEGPEKRVGPLVVDDEARVHGQAGIRPLRDDGRVRVAADVAVFLEQGHPVTALQEVGRHDAGYAGADDGDVHPGWRGHRIVSLEKKR